jgi:hypothetical protein
MTRGVLVGPLLFLWAHYLAVFKPQVIFLFYYFMFPKAGVVGGGLCGAIGGGPLHVVVILCLYIKKKIVCVCVCVCFFFLAMATHFPHIHAPCIISLGFKIVSN